MRILFVLFVAILVAMAAAVRSPTDVDVDRIELRDDSRGPFSAERDRLLARAMGAVERTGPSMMGQAAFDAKMDAMHAKEDEFKARIRAKARSA